MDRRAFVRTVALGLLAAPLGAEAQRAGKARAVGSARGMGAPRRKIGTLAVLLALALGAPAVPPGVEAQPTGKVARVGILTVGVEPSPEEAAKFTLFTSLRIWAGYLARTLSSSPGSRLARPIDFPSWRPT
jgi:hypothetical protein